MLGTSLLQLSGICLINSMCNVLSQHGSIIAPKLQYLMTFYLNKCAHTSSRLSTLSYIGVIPLMMLEFKILW
jgi:hypothetical protein